MAFPSRAITRCAASVEFTTGMPASRALELPGWNERIRELNARLRETFPADIVDFWSGMSPAEFTSDGIHVNDAGHAKRAAAARQALLH